uniref:Transposase (Putative), gypsy type n=1 Tax=Tanacetum cinerariifolium TaxID=118510 RepID=A0A6L2JLT2_TANCI|nr:hypothetical protein [Tanacetum cinerariifolium]
MLASTLLFNNIKTTNLRTRLARQFYNDQYGTPRGAQVKEGPLRACHILSGQSVAVGPDMGTTQWLLAIRGALSVVVIRHAVVPPRVCEMWLTRFICGLSSSDGFDCKDVPKDPFPKSSEFNAEHYATLVAHPAPFHKYPEPFLCLVGISRYYTLDENTYPESLGDDDEEMDLLSFIRTAEPTKVRVAERQRAEDEPRLLETTVGRVVPLLPVAPARASSELEASVDKLFEQGVGGGKVEQGDSAGGGDGQGADIQPVIATTDTIVEDKLREDYGALGGASAAGKSRSVVQSLFAEAVLNAEARGEPIPTLPFVTSSVFRSAPAIATVTTATVDAATIADRAPVEPYLFGVGSPQPVGLTVPVAFQMFCRVCREMLDEFAPPKFFASIRGMDHDQLFTEFNVGAARQISLSAEVRMRAEYNIRENRRLRSVVDEQAELLKVRDGEIENLKAQLLLKEAEAAEALRLRAEVFKFEATEKSLQGEVGVLRDHSATLEKEKNELSVKVTDLSASVKVREQEVADLDAQVTAVKLQNDNLVGQISSAGLREKVAVYEDFIGQLEKFQDEKIEEPRLAKPLRRVCRKDTHGAEGRKLADVAAYNPSAEADYLSALQRLQNVNFSLIAELKSNKDASVNTIMNLLRLDDTLAERLGLTESQPNANQLMVPIHHSPDQRVIDASALSLSLDVSHSRVRKIRENIASAEGTSGSAHDTTTALSVTLVSAGTIPPISTDDYEVAHEGASVDGENAADGNIDPFSDVSNAELNILE